MCFSIIFQRFSGITYSMNVFRLAYLSAAICNFVNENVWISLKISLKFVLKLQIDNIPAVILIMAWARPGDKPLSEPMLYNLLTPICVTLPQWVMQKPLIIFLISVKDRNYNVLAMLEIWPFCTKSLISIQFGGWSHWRIYKECCAKSGIKDRDK